MSFFSDWLDPGAGYDKGQNDINQALARSTNFLKPYQNAGTNQIGTLTNAENNLLDPEALLNKWVGGYQQSPYAKQQTAVAADAGMTSAAQQGLLGSSAALSNVQNSAANISNADRQQYLNDLMQKYTAGIGVGQNIFGIGATAGNNIANNVMQTGENQAQLDVGQNAARSSMLQKLISTGVGALTGGMGGASGMTGAPSYAGGGMVPYSNYGGGM